MAKILVVDDNPAVNDVLCQLCSFLGHEVVTAQNGAEGLALVRRDGAIALVFTDFRMPVMNGVEMLRGLKDLRPAMPVVGVDAIHPAPAVAVARVLRVIDALAGLQGADAFVALSVAMAGKAGVDELSEQTRGLFNLASPDPEIFPLQIAFNLMPLPDQEYDATLAEATRRLLGKSLAVGYSSIHAPMFFGAAVMLHARTAQPVALDKLRQALTRSDGITLMESDLPAGIPTPATDAAESDDVFIGRILATKDDLKLWLVFDPIRLEAAQIVDVVENWIDKPTNSMLT